MMSGSYVMDLYCDARTEDQWHRYDSAEGKLRVTGLTAAHCRRRARQLGWKIDLQTYLVVCPDCVRMGKTLADAKEE